MPAVPIVPALALVFAGGGAGACLRYLTGRLALALFGPGYPWGTLAANLLGGLAMGCLAGWLAFRSGPEQVRLLLGVGVLGGFTTFSSFGNDTMNLFRDGETVNALANIGANVILGLALVWLGRTVACWIWK